VFQEMETSCGGKIHCSQGDNVSCNLIQGVPENLTHFVLYDFPAP
jgi:hypothetical protein